MMIVPKWKFLFDHTRQAFLDHIENHVPHAHKAVRVKMLAEAAGRASDTFQLGVMDLGSLVAQRRGTDSGDLATRYPGRLALINPRTLAVTFPDQAPLGARPLSWSADRERLIFASNRQNGRYQLYELNCATGEVKVLAGGNGNFLAAAYGPAPSRNSALCRPLPRSASSSRSALPRPWPISSPATWRAVRADAASS